METFINTIKGDMILSPDKKSKHLVIDVITSAIHISYPFSDDNERATRIPWLWMTKEKLKNQGFSLLIDQEEEEKRKKKGATSTQSAIQRTYTYREGQRVGRNGAIYPSTREQTILLGSGINNLEFPAYNRPYFYLVMDKGVYTVNQAFYFGRQMDNERLLMGNCFADEDEAYDYLELQLRERA